MMMNYSFLFLKRAGHTAGNLMTFSITLFEYVHNFIDTQTQTNCVKILHFAE